MVTTMSTTCHLIINFNKRDKNDFLEEQPRLMEEIRAPPLVVVFFLPKEWENLIGTKILPLSIYEDLKSKCQLNYNIMGHLNIKYKTLSQ